MLYEDSKAVLQSVEAHVLGRSSHSSGFLDRLWREIIGPIKYVNCGLKDLEIFRGYTKFLILLIPIYFLGMYLAGPDFSSKGKNVLRIIVFLFGLAVPLFLTLFSLPSTYVHAGIRGSYVEEATVVIADKAHGGEQLNALKENVQAFEANVNHRISRFRIVLTGLWAYWLYLLGKSFIPAAGYQEMKQGGDDVFWLMVYFLFLLLSYILVESYNKANEILFSTIYLGINENKIRPRG